MREKSSYSFLRSLVKGQDHSFFKDLTGVFCTVGGTLVDLCLWKHFRGDSRSQGMILILLQTLELYIGTIFAPFKVDMILCYAFLSFFYK
jgi:hypothetical protein